MPTAGQLIIYTLVCLVAMKVANSKLGHANNPVVMKCSACDAKMTKHAWSRLWLTADFILWICFYVATGLWNAHMSAGLLVLLVIALSTAWISARDRLYHAYFAWRHPTRCDSGGHAEPQLNGGQA